MRIRELVPWRSRERDQLTHNGGGQSMQTAMHRLFDEFFEDFPLGPFGSSSGFETATMPKIDVAESDEAIHVTAELPGIKEQDVDVTLSDGQLVIRGEKKAEKEDKGRNYHRVERSYGSFHRSIPVPSEIDSSKVEATFQNGVLRIEMPKTAPSTAGKRIPVQKRD